MERARVAFIGVSPDQRGGIAQFGRELAEYVADDVETLVIGWRRLYPRFTVPGRQGRDPSRRKFRLAFQSTLVPWLPWTWRRTSRVLVDFRPQLVVVQWWNPLFGPAVRAILRRSRRAGARSMIMCHNARPHEHFPFGDWITRAALAEADLLAVFSQGVGDQITEFAPGRPLLVGALPPPLARDDDAEADAPADLPAGPRILFFGNVRAYKGLEDLLAALPIVRRDVDAKLIIAGTFMEPLSRFQRIAREAGVEDAVHFRPGYVPDEEVPSLFAACDVVVLPHRSASQSGIVGRAAVAGTPVVATRVGSLPEMLGGNGVLVEPSDPGSLAAGIVRALTDPPPPPRLDDSAWALWRDVVLEEAGASGRRPSR
jgi:glycosyltransferase involved in cell wall biosynthesis